MIATSAKGSAAGPNCHRARLLSCGMDEALLHEVSERLGAAGDKVSVEVSSLVLASCANDDTLRLAVDGEAMADPRQPLPSGLRVDEAGPRGTATAGAFLQSISVRGFRGIGPAATLELTPGPGLTVVAGRNGSGKSSFAEALEVLLTGSTARFETYRVFREGWRNQHDPGWVSLSAEICVDGQADPVTVVHEWPKDARLDGGHTTVRVGEDDTRGLASLGWADAVATYRPFLAHSELEAMFVGKPSDLHDRVSAVLGLDALTLAVKRLGEHRLRLEKEVRATEERRRELVAELSGVEDDRARAGSVALSAAPTDFATLGQLLAGGAVADGDQMQALRRLAGLTLATRAEVDPVVAALSAAADRLDATAGSDADLAKRTAHLLEQALALHVAHPLGTECPVCGTADVLDDRWRAHAQREVQRLRSLADVADEAAGLAVDALRRAERFAHPDAGVAADLQRSGLDGAGLQRAVDRWVAHPAADARAGDATVLRALAAHLGSAIDPLEVAVERMRQQATDELGRRDSLWLPVAERLAGWIEDGRAAASAGTRAVLLKRAETWLKRANDEIRNARLQPIAERTRAIWAELRHESNVDLGEIVLAGSGTSRRVRLDVTVDGAPGPALGMMSQGELNALALSVFLPRAAMASSPFRFVVIDDPVQSMDPAKVAGLARVLAAWAHDRQVVVFTHDERLPAAIRRLDLPARILNVNRRPDSVVEIRPDGDPVSRLLDDADAVAREPRMPAEVVAIVVAGICRDAVEARLTTAATGLGLRHGRRLADVETDLVAAKRLREKAALAFFGDAERHGEVRGELMRLGHRHAETFDLVNTAVHTGVSGDARLLVSATRRLIDALDGRLS